MPHSSQSSQFGITIQEQNRMDGDQQSSGGWHSNDGRLSCGFSSLKGKRLSMEDFYDIKVLQIGKEAVYLFGVFDGHGGAHAAEYLKEHLFDNLTKHPKLITDTNLAICETYKQTDRDFLEAEINAQRDDGSTASTAILIGNHLYIANVGDSRAVISKAGQAVQLSEDHKPNRTDERKRIENAGGIVMWAGTWRVGGVLAMSRAFGDRLLKQFVVPDPEIRVEMVDKGLDFLILASDGLWDYLKNQEAVAVVTSESEPVDAARKLTESALAAGSGDNITCIVVKFHHNGTTAPKTSAGSAGSASTTFASSAPTTSAGSAGFALTTSAGSSSTTSAGSAPTTSAGSAGFALTTSPDSTGSAPTTSAGSAGCSELQSPAHLPPTAASYFLTRSSVYSSSSGSADVPPPAGSLTAGDVDFLLPTNAAGVAGSSSTGSADSLQTMFAGSSSAGNAHSLQTMAAGFSSAGNVDSLLDTMPAVYPSSVGLDTNLPTTQDYPSTGSAAFPAFTRVADSSSAGSASSSLYAISSTFEGNGDPFFDIMVGRLDKIPPTLQDDHPPEGRTIHPTSSS